MTVWFHRQSSNRTFNCMFGGCLTRQTNHWTCQKCRRPVPEFSGSNSVHILIRCLSLWPLCSRVCLMLVHVQIQFRTCGCLVVWTFGMIAGSENLFLFLREIHFCRNCRLTRGWKVVTRDRSCKVPLLLLFWLISRCLLAYHRNRRRWVCLFDDLVDWWSCAHRC